MPIEIKATTEVMIATGLWIINTQLEKIAIPVITDKTRNIAIIKIATMNCFFILWI